MWCCGVLIALGRLEDLGSWVLTITGFCNASQTPLRATPPCAPGFGASFYRTIYRKFEDCFDRPVRSAPGTWLDVEHRRYTNGTPGPPGGYTTGALGALQGDTTRAPGAPGRDATTEQRGCPAGTPHVHRERTVGSGSGDIWSAQGW